MKTPLFTTFFLFFLGLLFIPLLSAAPPVTEAFNFDSGFAIASSPQVYLEQSQDYSVNWFVYNQSSGTIVNNATINCSYYLANYTGDEIYSTSSPTRNPNYWSVLIDGGNFTILGEYNYGIACDGGQAGGVKVGVFEVTQTGSFVTEETVAALNRGFYMMLCIAILLFLAFLVTKENLSFKWSFFVLSLVFLLISLNIATVTLTDQIVNSKLIDLFDVITAISFYLYWFAAGLLAIIWMFGVIGMLGDRRAMRDAAKFGGTPDYGS